MLKSMLVGAIVAILVCGIAGAADGDTFDKSLTDPMDFRVAISGGNCSFCTWIAAEGTIDANTPARFSQFIADRGLDVPGSGNIHLNSPGGDLLAGMRLGELIRKHGFNTIVAKTIGREDATGTIWLTDDARCRFQEGCSA